jgi:uncharacterized phage-like protein YoqJ
MTTICGTGHRPPKLGGYSPAVFETLITLAGEWLDTNMPDGGTVISGMALGWDQALAAATLRRRKRGFRLHAYIPFVGQADAWPTASHAVYQHIMTKAARIVVVSEGGYSPEAMQRRNERMVDDSEMVLALWDGSPGGTGNCVRYAEKVGKPVANLWELYQFEV